MAKQGLISDSIEISNRIVCINVAPPFAGIYGQDVFERYVARIIRNMALRENS